jgi:CheY-like chemotaxis protein
MARTGPVLLIEDDENDIEVICAALRDLKVENPVHVFRDGQSALAYLRSTDEQPFFILSDIRMPAVDGISLRRTICKEPYLRRKSIPFIFLSGIATQDIINEAYDLSVQGFYRKAKNYVALKDQLYGIVVYWRQCLHPNESDD